MFCQRGRGKTRNGRSTKRHPNRWAQKCFWAVWKKSQLVYFIKQRVLWRQLKFNQVTINIQLLQINFKVFGFPLYVASSKNNIFVGNKTTGTNFEFLGITKWGKIYSVGKLMVDRASFSWVCYVGLSFLHLWVAEALELSAALPGREGRGRLYKFISRS